MTLLEALKILGGIALMILGLVLLNLLGFWQATSDMSPEEKADFVKYIEKNGILGGDDDDFPF